MIQQQVLQVSLLFSPLAKSPVPSCSSTSKYTQHAFTHIWRTQMSSSANRHTLHSTSQLSISSTRLPNQPPTIVFAQPPNFFLCVQQQTQPTHKWMTVDQPSLNVKNDNKCVDDCNRSSSCSYLSNWIAATINNFRRNCCWHCLFAIFFYLSLHTHFTCSRLCCEIVQTIKCICFTTIAFSSHPFTHPFYVSLKLSISLRLHDTIFIPLSSTFISDWEINTIVWVCASEVHVQMNEWELLSRRDG